MIWNGGMYASYLAIHREEVYEGVPHFFIGYLTTLSIAALYSIEG